jgi:glucose uptake protein GlcU
LAWRWEWVGAALYGAAGMLYVAMLLPRVNPPAAIKLIWMLMIAGPAFAIAALFLVSWVKRAEIRMRP